MRTARAECVRIREEATGEPAGEGRGDRWEENAAVMDVSTGDESPSERGDELSGASEAR